MGRWSDKIQWLNGVYAKDEKKMQKKQNNVVDVKRDKRITETEGRVWRGMKGKVEQQRGPTQ
jgi:hypothetical protein